MLSASAEVRASRWRSGRCDCLGIERALAPDHFIHRPFHPSCFVLERAIARD
jgi:hypothetical protein